MIKSINKKHLILLLILCFVIIVFGIELISAIQESRIEYVTGDIKPYQVNDIRVYNIEGLTDKEVEDYLELQRENLDEDKKINEKRKEQNESK